MSSFKYQSYHKDYSINKTMETHQKTAKFCIGIQKGLNNQASLAIRENNYFLL